MTKSFKLKSFIYAGLAAAVFTVTETPAAELHDCDRLAAHPDPALRVAGVAGVYLEEIDSAMAIGACEAAVASVPQEPRFRFQLGRALKSIEKTDAGLNLTLERVGKDKIEQIEADKVLVAIGRRPVTRGLGLEELGVSMTARGVIEVDETFQTSVPGIFAIGDCVPGPMLAHKAEEDGVACVAMIAGEAGHIDYNCVPGVVYTDPEVASVGLTEEALEEAGTEYITGKFTFMANSRARASGETDGAVKVLADPAGKILGAHVCGAHGGDLLSELVLAMAKGITVKEVAETCHAHPALGEAVKEACLDALGRAIHA